MIRPLVLVLVALAWPAAASAAPIRSAIFFYPWYSTAAHDGGYAHWQQGSHTPPWDIGSVYFPARGAYSSADPHVLVAQMRDIRRARVDEVVSSWWGPGSPEDDRLPMIRRIARREGLNVAVQLEPYRGRSIASIGEDLAYLRGLGIHDVYVYRSEDFPAEAWATLPLKFSGVRTFAQTSRIGFAAKAGFDGFYTYDILVYGGDQFARPFAEGPRGRLRREGRVRRLLHIRHPRLRRGQVRAPVRRGTRGEAALRAVRRPGLRRRAGDRRPEREAAGQRRDVRHDVARRSRGRRRSRHDHELQRVERGHPDRARRPRRALRELRGRLRPARPGRAVCVPARHAAVDGPLSRRAQAVTQTKTSA